MGVMASDSDNSLEDDIFAAINEAVGESTADDVAAVSESAPPSTPEVASGDNSDDDLLASMGIDFPDEAPANSGEASAASSPAAPASGGDKKPVRNLERLLDITVPVIVKIAEKKVSINDVLRFNQGTVVSFDKDAYDQLELMINNSTIGLGQCVKVGENFGLRVLSIGDVGEKIKSLGGLVNNRK